MNGCNLVGVVIIAASIQFGFLQVQYLELSPTVTLSIIVNKKAKVVFKPCAYDTGYKYICCTDDTLHILFPCIIYPDC